VAFDVGGISDWLADGINGRLIDPGLGAAGFGHAIAEVLASPDLWRKLSAASREAAARFSVGHHLRLLMPVLERGAHAD
jgi:glycosyltransferase involved in cell wall biosynthesis